MDRSEWGADRTVHLYILMWKVRLTGGQVCSVHSHVCAVRRTHAALFRLMNCLLS